MILSYTEMARAARSTRAVLQRIAELHEANEVFTAATHRDVAKMCRDVSIMTMHLVESADELAWELLRKQRVKPPAPKEPKPAEEPKPAKK